MSTSRPIIRQFPQEPAIEDGPRFTKLRLCNHYSN
jgi:hypothetical protein